MKHGVTGKHDQCLGEVGLQIVGENNREPTELCWAKTVGRTFHREPWPCFTSNSHQVLGSLPEPIPAFASRFPMFSDKLPADPNFAD